MCLHHWLAWLAVNLAILLLGVGMSQPPPEPVAMTAFDDAYLVPTAPRGLVTEPRKSRLADEKLTGVRGAVRRGPRVFSILGDSLPKSGRDAW